MSLCWLGSHDATAQIESWQFSEAAGTGFTGLINSAGTATWPTDVAFVTTDGNGGLQFTQGDSPTANIFRSANLSSPNQNSGKYALEWAYSSATLSDLASGDNVGFGIRDTSANVDPFVVRLYEQSGTLRLQTRINNVNSELFNFGTDSLTSPLVVQAVADLDNDLLDVHISGAENQSFIGIALPDLEMDAVRMIARTNALEWGAADEVTVDYLTLSQFVNPNPPVTLEINTTTGMATIQNTGGANLDIDFYEITSASGSLNPAGWTSLQDQDLTAFPAGDGTGNGWEELGLVDPAGDFNRNGIVDAADYTVWQDNLGGDESALGGNGDGSGIVDAGDLALWESSFGNTAAPSPERFTEAYLLGSSQLIDGTAVSLGEAFQITGSQDLEFIVRLENGTVLDGDVQYVSAATVPEPTRCWLLSIGFCWFMSNSVRRAHLA